MLSFGSGPGKTAPKLLQDFLLFDPVSASSRANANSLTNVSPPPGEGAPLVPVSGCKHEYRTKHCQSISPPPDSRPTRGVECKTAVICKKCRLHADVQASFADASNPCPNSDFPFHHFQRVYADDSQTSQHIRYAWQCSAHACGASLWITFRPLRIKQDHKILLTDPELLKKRYEAVVREDPTREGIRQATPIDALSRLRKYVKDSLDPTHTRRTFPGNNKRFMEAFGLYGRDCAAILTSLGFVSAARGDSPAEIVSDESGVEEWALPQPPVLENRLQADGSTAREMLEDVELELVALIHQISQETGAVNPVAGEGWPSAEKDLERMLGASGYLRYVSSRRLEVSNREISCFAALGALPDFADASVEFAYERQASCEPVYQPAYIECLEIISEFRKTERLQVKVATLLSQGLVSRREIVAAYSTLGISMSDGQRSDDDRLLNVFHAQQSDLGPEAQEDARRALYKLGIHRDSQKLLSASRQTIESYDDALAWLGNGADKQTPDEMLLAVVALKDGKENEAMAQKAISIIAKERKSEYLNNWLLTGQTGGHQMTTEEALRHLGIEQNLNEIDPTVLPLYLDNARIDKPGEMTEKAIATMQQALAGIPITTRSPETWPVGLTSHGNTCYLNSLLQYYFCIAPFRNIILNYDEYKLDITKQKQKRERVGYLPTTPVEILGGQRFANDLQHLFQRMIKEPTDQLKPEQDLVCRAFLNPKDYALLASDGNVAQNSDNIVNDRVPDGPTNMLRTDSNNRHESDASSTTLQPSLNGEGQDMSGAHNNQAITPPALSRPEVGENSCDTTLAPPLPPRRFSTSRQKALEMAQEKARAQQDVTEVHDAIMARLRYGMKPRGRDESDEQEDALRDLFKIEMIETQDKSGLDGDHKMQFNTVIQSDVPYENTDLYSLLDAFFDLQPYAESKEDVPRESFKSLRALPPVLQISVPRIGFDKGVAFKTETCVKLEDELYLDRYTGASGSELLRRRKDCWLWRKQLRALKKERKALFQTVTDLDGPSTVSEAAKYLDSLADINDDLESAGLGRIENRDNLSRALTVEADLQTTRLATLQAEITDLERRLKNEFINDKDIKYRLAAVFFHRGSVGHGHYWIYIHDFEKDVWRSYNDERVEEFSDINKILEARSWQEGTPTYAAYVKDDQKMEIIQPVYRAPEKPQTQTLQPDGAREKSSDTCMGNSTDAGAQTIHPNALHGSPQFLEEAGEHWDAKRQVPDINW